MIVYHDSIGTCMGSEWQDCTDTVIDTAAPITRATSCASATCTPAACITSSSASHALGPVVAPSATDGVFPIHPMGFVPDAIHKVIAREPRLGPVPILADFPRADTSCARTTTT